jgi:hypothetical protein
MYRSIRPKIHLYTGPLLILICSLPLQAQSPAGATDTVASHCGKGHQDGSKQDETFVYDISRSCISLRKRELPRSRCRGRHRLRTCLRTRKIRLSCTKIGALEAPLPIDKLPADLQSLGERTVKDQGGLRDVVKVSGSAPLLFDITKPVPSCDPTRICFEQIEFDPVAYQFVKAQGRAYSFQLCREGNQWSLRFQKGDVDGDFRLGPTEPAELDGLRSRLATHFDVTPDEFRAVKFHRQLGGDDKSPHIFFIKGEWYHIGP